MRIVHFVRHSVPLQSDGYSLRTRAIVQSQQRWGDSPAVVTSPEFAHEHRGQTLAALDKVDGIAHFHCTDHESAIRRLATRLPLVRRYLRHARAARYYRRVVQQCLPCDLFHVHMQPATVRHLMPLSRHYRIPLIYEVRGVWEDSMVACRQMQAGSKEYSDAKRESTRAAERAAWVITISEGLRRDFVARGIPGHRITVVPNGVDTAAFTPVAPDPKLAEALGVSGKTVYGCISSIRELEGLEYLIQAMPHVLEAMPNSACLIVGDGDDRPRLESVAKALGLQQKVIFAGRVPHADIRAYYSIIDVFVIPRPNRRVNQLVTPLKPLEAMAMEKALLVSGVGGLTEIVQDGDTGLVFKPEDVHDLANKAILLAKDQSQRRRLAQQARRYAVRERDWSTVIKKYQEVVRCISPTIA
jgi:PEP-CTERM/exosortase A-associated glycosyltransferase